MSINYIFFRNGLIIQWGSTTSSSSPKSVGFPTSFSVAPRVVAIGLRSGGEHRTDNLILLSIDTTSFSFSWFDHGNAYTVNWIAIGY